MNIKPGIYALLLTVTMGGCTTQSGLLIKNVTIVSPVAPYESAGANVLIQDGAIKQISYKPLRASQIIDGKGKFLTPGLIDSHVHLRTDAGMREDHAEENPKIAEAFYAQEPYSYLFFGFTTLVDLSLSEKSASEWRANADSPDLVYCKRLNLVDGYGMAFTPEDKKFLSPYFIYNKGQENRVPDNIDLSMHTPVAVIGKVLETDASCIKTFHESGFGGLFDWPTPTDELISEITRLADENNLIHTHHGNTVASWRQAAATSMDVLAHGLWHWEEFNSEDQLPDEIVKILDAVIKNETAIQITSQVIEGEIRIFDPAFLESELLQHSLPSQLIAWHKSENGSWFRDLMIRRLEKNPKIVEAFLGHEPRGGVSETSETAMRRLQQVAKYLDDHGAILLLGSDSPASPTYTNPPGLNGYLEIQALARFGVSPLKLLQAATINNARAFGIEDEVGTIEEGKKANLLLLRENPLLSVSAYNEIELVIKGGKLFPRDELSAANRSRSRSDEINTN